jgi:hypothetical protein
MEKMEVRIFGHSLIGIDWAGDGNCPGVNSFQTGLLQKYCGTLFDRLISNWNHGIEANKSAVFVRDEKSVITTNSQTQIARGGKGNIHGNEVSGIMKESRRIFGAGKTGQQSDRWTWIGGGQSLTHRERSDDDGLVQKI